MTFDKGVPIPESKRPRGPASELPRMEIGDSRFVTGDEARKIHSRLSQLRRRHPPFQCTTRKVTENGVVGIRFWRIA